MSETQTIQDLAAIDPLSWATIDIAAVFPGKGKDYQEGVAIDVATSDTFDIVIQDARNGVAFAMGIKDAKILIGILSALVDDAEKDRQNRFILQRSNQR